TEALHHPVQQGPQWRRLGPVGQRLNIIHPVDGLEAFRIHECNAAFQPVECTEDALALHPPDITAVCKMVAWAGRIGHADARRCAVPNVEGRVEWSALTAVNEM